MDRKFKTAFIAGLLVCLFANTVCGEAIITSKSNTTTQSEVNFNTVTRPTYSTTINEMNIVAFSETGVTKNSTVAKKDGVISISENEAFVELSVNIKDEGYYNLNIEYCSITEKVGDFETRILINNEVQLPSAANVKLLRRYVDISPIEKDSNGNDIRPEKKEEKAWISQDVEDSKGIYNEPLLFKFKAGANVIRIDAINAGFAINTITIHNNLKSSSYHDYQSVVAGKEDFAANVFKKVQGENTSAVSSTILYPTYDKSSAITEPQDPVKLRLNTIGQSNWKMPGQWIEWEINVPKNGFYNIGMRVRQNYIRGNYSSRNILIDGKIVFDDMKNVRFTYNINWYIKNIGDNNPEYVYLDAGKHTIRIEVVSGVAGTVISKFNEDILKLNNLYRKMIMITGVSPDPYRDYKLNDDIPQLLDNFNKIFIELENAKNEISKLGIKSGSDAVVVEKLAAQLESFIQKPDSIPSRLEDFRNNVSSVSSWLLTLKEQPLEIDYIFIKGKNKQLPPANSSFFIQITYRLATLFGSFFNNYSMIANDTKKENVHLNVWVNLGRDQAQIVKDLSQNYFEKENKYSVNISLVQQGLTEAIASGKGPDVALYTGAADSVNFASRGAIEDISKYSNYPQIEKRYVKNSITPFMFNEGVYGLPLDQNFNMMFYRTDIFNELQISPPKTWDEFYNDLIIIQKSHLLVGIPVGNATLPDNSIFDILLFQRNGTYYNSNFSQTSFKSEAALKAFKQWTDFYSKYNLPLTYDFYNRFRSGEMPLGITSYTMYNMLSVAAPEIEGLWNMIPVPGTLQNDGSINNTTSGGATGLIVLKSTKNKEAAFKYIDWFTSAKTQTDYGIAVENLFGQAGRYDPANIESLKSMNWNGSTLKVLLSQLDNLKMAPQVPASYEVTRDLTNAFRSVVISGKNPRDSLYTYNAVINTELQRKRKELNLD